MKTIEQHLRDGERWHGFSEKRDITVWYKGGFYWLKIGSSATSFVNINELVCFLFSSIGVWHRKDGEQI